MAPKLGPGSIWSSEDQIAWYRENRGDAAADEQIRLARLRAGKCVCEPRKLKRKWNGERLTVRAVHDKACPKRKPWMDLV